MDRRNHRVLRKQLLIYPQFQLTLILFNWSVITLVFGILKMQSTQIFSDMTPLLGLAKVSADFSERYIGYLEGRFNSALILGYVMAIIASGALSLMVSYRFAGPIVRLRSYFRGLSKPEIPVNELHFRSGDFFSDIPPVVNSAIKRIQNDRIKKAS